MDVRVLQYFLAVAKHGSVSEAAEALNMSQPPLSRQLRDLEEELGKPLFIRERRKMTLTEDGLILRGRAEEIIALMQKAKAEIQTSSENIVGEVAIGGGDTDGMKLAAKAIRQLQLKHPNIFYHLLSCNTIQALERIDTGLLDFGVLIIPPDESRYEAIQLPAHDSWGLVMRKDSPLSEHRTISPEDLRDLPIIMPQTIYDETVNKWLPKGMDLKSVASYNTISNAALLVEEGVGYAIGIDKLKIAASRKPLCWRPLEPRLDMNLYLAWKKYRLLPKAAEAFLRQMQQQQP